MSEIVFSTTRTAPATALAVWEPVRTALVSLMALTDDTLSASADAWVLQTAARLTPEQRERNRQVFTEFGPLLLPALDAPDFPAFLATLAQSPDAAARHLLAPHLRELWEQFLQAEWQRHAPQLRTLTEKAISLQVPTLTGSAIDLTRGLVRRMLPDWVVAQLAGATKVVFALSPHVKLYADRFGHADTAYVFAQFDNAMMRIAPLQRAEVLGPLASLADDSRLRLLELLAANGEMRAQDLIAQLGASQPNVSRHLKQLVGAGLVDERRAGDTNKLYRLRPDGASALFGKLDQLLSEGNARAALAGNAAVAQRNAALAEYPSDLRPFVDETGRVVSFSTKPKEQKPVLSYLLGKFERSRTYTEREATDLIARWLKPSNVRFGGIDAVTLRRALVDEMGLRRAKDGSKYWVE